MNLERKLKYYVGLLVLNMNLIEYKKLIRENKLRIGIITLDVSEIKKVCTPKAYNFIMSACKEYKKTLKTLFLE